MTTSLNLIEPISFDSIAASGYEAHIKSGEAERKAIASAFDLVDVPSFTADVLAKKSDKDTVLLEGRVVADVIQSCVVSLEPVTQTIDEMFATLLTTADSPIAPSRPGADVHVDPEDDSPDVLADGRIDISAIVLEHFALAIDPYPRLPGVVVPSEYEKSPGSHNDSPFAALAKISSDNE